MPSEPKRVSKLRITIKSVNMFRLKGTMFVLALVGLLAPACTRQAAVREADATGQQVVAFIAVNVVPMDRERIIKRQTVLIRDGIISEIGPVSEVQVPTSALRINGQGRYLMPGLADMHVHAWKENLLLYVANGVTTVRFMDGHPVILAWRESIAQGELLGPTIYTSGPIIDGRPPAGWPPNPSAVETAEEAERVVAEQKEAGYDFIKVYNNLSQEAYEGLVAAAKKHRMPVVGHISLSVGLAGVLAAGQASIEHLTNNIFEIVTPDSPIKPGTNFRSRVLAWNYADTSLFAGLAEASREAGVWYCPTLVWNQHVFLPEEEHLKLFARDEMKYLSWRSKQWIPKDRSHVWYLKDYTEDDFHAAQRVDEIQKRFLKALHDADVNLLLGTDSWIRGFAVQEEFQIYVDAGISPYEAIKTGTRNSAEFLNALDTFGTVTVGKRADLILVEGNPLEDVANVARQTGVMIRGRWLPDKELQRMLEALALVNEGENLARQGSIMDAMASYSRAQTLDSTQFVSSSPWNTLCWYGSLSGYAADVMTACEQAVALAPDWGGIRDSRGLARALTDDFEGAIADFEAYVAWTSNDERRSQRQGWIDALRRDENPFTPEVLETLRTP